MIKKSFSPFRLKIVTFTAFSFVFLLLSLLLLRYVFLSSPYARSQWVHAHRSSIFSPPSSFLTKKCNFVAVIITSDQDYNNGTIHSWFHSLPENQTDQVCCVSVRRSHDTSFHLQTVTNSCDVLLVPMVRADEYLTISEKVHLTFAHITDYYSFNWLLKTDVDSFVCFSRILTLQQNYDPNGVIQMGYAESRNILLEDPRHYWYDPSMTDIVHNPRQPVVQGSGLYHPYMQGAGYILSWGALSRLQAILPSLRYSPMEDAMVGSWLLSFNAHHVVLDLDLRGERGVCNLPPHLYISHNRKGGSALDECHLRHPDCASVPKHPAPPLRDVSFLITTKMSQHYKQVMDLYHSIRAVFPTNHVLFADASDSDIILSRLLNTVKDPFVRGFSKPNIDIGSARNILVTEAPTTYVCILQDEQRLSWETMIARMLRVVENRYSDIATGYLKFNPNMNHSAVGLYANGFLMRGNKGDLWKHWVNFDYLSPNASVAVNGTSGFLLARRDFLLANPWKDLGPFTDDEWHVRLRGNGARITLVNSAVRHGYHYELDQTDFNTSMVISYAQKTCKALQTQNVVRIADVNTTLDCNKRVYKSMNLDELYFKW